MKLFLLHLFAATVLMSVSCTFSYAQEPDSIRKEKPKIVRKPSFQGGDINAFARWISQRIQYPKALLNSNIEGRLVMKFFWNVTAR